MVVKGGCTARVGYGTSEQLLLACEKHNLTEPQNKHRKEVKEKFEKLRNIILKLAENAKGDQSLGEALKDLVTVVKPPPNLNVTFTPPAPKYAPVVSRGRTPSPATGATRKTETGKGRPTTAGPSEKAAKANQAPPPPRSTRTTRRSTGSLPPPRIPQEVMQSLVEDPDIEMLAERTVLKALPNAVVPAPPPPSHVITPVLTNPVPLPPRADVGHNMQLGAPHRKGDDLILLNIAVRPKGVLPPAQSVAKRKELDSTVKSALMKSPSQFVEWLLKEGLVRSFQFCTIHKYPNNEPMKLKLGMFSDPKILTTSGGYVWISECCGRKYISVYSGSVFGASPDDPTEKVPATSILKLIYHWSCQTVISSVENWVKIKKPFISLVYQYLRAVCTIMLQEKQYDFGFNSTVVELGIVSLGTTSVDGSKKAVKVEILGLFDRHKKAYRLFSSTPEPENTSKERFRRILEPLTRVVHRNAQIICDQSVDPSCIHSYNIRKVVVSRPGDEDSNAAIMFYLRKHIPKMFQQIALSNLTLNQVQSILDELCWREFYAESSLKCYESMLEHISYLTSRESEGLGIIPLLDMISQEPHRNWRYKNKVGPQTSLASASGSELQPVHLQIPANSSAVVIPKNTQPLVKIPVNVGKSGGIMAQGLRTVGPASSPAAPKPVASPASSTATTTTSSPPVEPQPPQLIQYQDLESYFYGEVDGDTKLGQEPNSCVFKCSVCAATVEDNILFYEHLKWHISGQTKTETNEMCPYCCAVLPNKADMDNHKTMAHYMNLPTQLCCRICNEECMSELNLKNHMIRKHVEAELPYRCEICNYASSFFHAVIDHFSKNHAGTPYVLCHWCLSVKTITPDGANSFSARIYQHLQKHSQPPKQKCRSCRLTFYSKNLQTEHRKEHLSCANVAGLKRYQPPPGRSIQFRPALRTSVPQNLPQEKEMIAVRHNVAMSLVEAEQGNFKYSFGKEECYCIECDAPLHAVNHFRRYQKCTRCSYSTCCQSMIAQHAQIFHPIGKTRPLTYCIGPPVVLPTEMYCTCGFSTKSGNHLARHLATCGRTTAYPMDVHEDDESEISALKIPKIEDYSDYDRELPLEVELNEM